MAAWASQSLTETLYCRVAQEVSTQVQLLQAPSDPESGEENLPADICDGNTAQPEGGREGQERSDLCVWLSEGHSRGGRLPL